MPTYDLTYESEIYTIGGEQLTFKDEGKYVLPNRTEGFQKKRDINIEKDGTKRFYPRIEGSYNKIIRHGNSPSTYWWEVIDKNGTKSYFGGNGGSVDDNAVLRQTPNGNIGYWALKMTVDINGNYVEYTYDNSKYSSPSKSVMGKEGIEHYIKSIEYTKHATPSPKTYSVNFITKTGRPDIQVSGRLGFLQVTSRLLDKVQIRYGADSVRSYKFQYESKDKSFYKTRLISITEHGEKGLPFYTNRMEYNDAPDNIFSTPKEWGLTFQNSPPPIESNYFVGGFSNDSGIYKGNYTALNSNKSDSKNNTFRLGFWGYKPSPTYIPLPIVGFIILPIMEMNRLSVGASGGFGNGKNHTQISMFDVDGDNLPDVLYKIGDKVYFAKNTVGGFKLDGKNELGINSLGYTESSNWNVGLDGNMSIAKGIKLGIGFDYLNSTSKNSIYFNDFNGDGLVDLSYNGKVLFNYSYFDPAKIRRFKFDEASSFTPSPINITQKVSSSGSFSFNSDEKKMMLEQNPLHDIVRVWVAPKAGDVTVSGNVNLVPQKFKNPKFDGSQPESLPTQCF